MPFLVLLVLALSTLAPRAQAQETSRPRPLALETLDGRLVTSRALARHPVVVLAWTGLECPMAKLYLPRLREIAAEFRPRGVRTFVVDSNPQDSVAELAAWKRERRLELEVVRDAGGVLARRFGVRRTTEVVVLDAGRRVVYRGAVDDRYGFRRGAGGGVRAFRRPGPRREFLRQAVLGALEGREVKPARTEPYGCAITQPRAVRTTGQAPTFHEDVEPILQRRCQECHREAGNAPFALVDYEDAAGWADMIEEVVAQRAMPPWNADPGVGAFANDRSLPADEIETLLRWCRAGAPRGDPARAPRPRRWPEEWSIGEPDVVFEAPEFEVAAEGRLPYRYVRIPTHFEEDRWIQAAEIRSSSPGVVHHVLVFALPPRGRPRSKGPWTPRWHWSRLYAGLPPAERRAAMLRHRRYYRDMLVAGGGIFGYLLGALPGDPAMVLPPGHARYLPAGAVLVLQIHYTPDGTPRRSTTRVALRFAGRPPRHVRDVRAAANVVFEIPPGAAEHPVEASYRFPRGATLVALRPHLHLRGKSVRYVLEHLDGRREALLHVPRYDFDWQLEYVLAQPRRVEKGEVLHVHATFDNSAENPDNPDPTRTVRFGLQTDEEMMIGYFEVIWDRAGR